jgi:cell wall-associated NlpC family hydrolase
MTQMKNFRRGLAVLALSSGLAITVLAPSPASAAAPSPRAVAYAWALTQRGKPYIWGGSGPWGYDCSGLVYAAYRRAGDPIPRTTYGMLASGKLVWERTPRRGDLAFFGSGHVELYTGGRWTFGAQTFGTRVGYHLWSIWWHPTAFYQVRYAG